MEKSNLRIEPPALARGASSFSLLARWLSGAARWLAVLRGLCAGDLELARRAVVRFARPAARRLPRAPLAGLEQGAAPTAGATLVSLGAAASFRIEVRVNGRDSTLPIDIARADSGAPSGSESRRSESRRSESRRSESRRSEMQRAVALANGDVEVRIESRRLAVARLWLPGCAHAARARQRISAIARDLLQIGMNAVPHHAVPVGCIPALDVREAGAGHVEVLLYSDESSRPSQRVLRALARALARPLRRLGECADGAVLQLGVVMATRARASCRVELEALCGALAPGDEHPGDAAVSMEGWMDVLLRRFSANGHAPQLAARHNAHVLEAMAAAARALGLDPARLEAGAHSHAARWGSCEPLVRWRRCPDHLWGELLLPVDRASVEQALAVSRPGRHALELRHLADDLLSQAAAVGLLASITFLCASLARSAPAPGRCGPPALPAPPRAPEGRATAAHGGSRPDSGVYRRVDASDAASDGRARARTLAGAQDS